MKCLIATAAVVSCALMSVYGAANDDEFEKIAKDYVEGYLAAHPESATALGDHRFDEC